ncbi:MAG: TonB-dependent receptor [Bacteroidetes bacterium]|nr:TonB-dependent receptor [Bacteroidota bacterium]
MKKVSPFKLVKNFAFLILNLSFFTVVAQQKISGVLTDKSTKQPLAFAAIVIKGTTTGVTTDINGAYELTVDFADKEEVILQVAYVGYSKREVTLEKGETTIDLWLEPTAVYGKEVVVTGSRVSETILESPVSIKKMNSKEIKEAASGDFYESMGNLGGVDVNQSSMGFKTVNMRGFNSTAPIRMVQFVDGMDNQAPGLNFPLGNLVGVSDIDLHSVEIITGAASALYGPNAFQGVVSMTSKNPYDFPGTTVQLKGATNNLVEAQFRHAQTFGKNNKWGGKITGSFTRADDWVADDTAANKYGDISTTQDLSAIVRGLKYDSDPQKASDFTKLNDWLDFNQEGFRGLGKKKITAPGYMESDLSDNKVKSLKLGAELHYKFSDSLRASYVYKLGQGTAVYQGSNRYSINNILFQQHKLELTGKRFFVKAYTTRENAGDSYDIVFTGINVSKEGVPQYISEYLSKYFNTLSDYTDEFSDDLKPWMVDTAISRANIAANSGWYKPGTAAFDSIYNKIVNDPRLETGSKFLDKSSFTHVEGQYNFNFKFADVIAGGSARLFKPRSFGTIFRDTLIDPSDTLADGRDNPKGKYLDLSTYEVGGYIQMSKEVYKTENTKLKLIGSVRVDKNQNFDPQLSPRISAVYSHKNSVFRFSAQSAFRSPTLQNQYLMLDIGPIILSGNLDGFSNLYTLESVNAFNAHYDSTYEISPSLLETVKLDPVKPEQVRTVELGYRGVIANKVYVDANAYYSIYDNFIGDTRVVLPNGDAVAGEENGMDAILTKSYRLYQTPINAKESVSSYGGGLGLAYYFSPVQLLPTGSNQNYSISTNYTYAALDTSKLAQDKIIPGFNTPKHKVNIGVKGNNLYKNLGFSSNFQWVDTYRWESTFGNGDISSYRIVDVQLFYEFPKYHSTVRLGCSNLLNEKRREAYGAPTIGRMAYVTWLCDVGAFKNK